MTLRVRYDNLFNTWRVEYLNSWTGKWNTCEEFYNGKNTYASFKTEEEAEAFKDWKNAKYERENAKDSTTCVIPHDYYGVRGRYYGD